MLNWIESRTGFISMSKDFLTEDIPGGASYWYVFGSATLFAMILQIATGIFLTFFYAPSASTAWESTRAMYMNPFTHFLLSVHYWGASAMIALVFLHLLQVLIFGAYKSPRELQWIVCGLLLVVTLVLGLTGYLLPWDMNAYFASQVALNITGTAPIAGPLLQNIAQGGGVMGTNTINRFFGLHVWLMPAALLALVGAHLAIFRYNGPAGPVTSNPREKAPGRFWPDQMFMDAVASLIVFILVIMLALFAPPFLDAKADPANLATFVPYPAWYFLDLFGLLPSLGGGYPALYLAACMSMSSTMIVVKLLYDKHDLDTLPGRITLGALVFQDVWAVVMLAVQPNLTNPDFKPLAVSLLEGAGLVIWALAMSKYVLPRVFRAVAKAPELVLVTALAWCFFLAAAASIAGLSREMGALIAGVSISTFPYSADVGTKVGSIRDFFVTLFFVALGMQIAVPSPNVLLVAAAAAAFVVASRAVVVPILYAAGLGQRASILPAVNLANISEFSIVIASLGLARGHIDSSVVTVVILTFAITSVSSTYLISASGRVYIVLHRVLHLLHVPDLDRDNEEVAAAHPDADVVFLGFFRDASSVLHEFEHHGPRRHRHQLLDHVVVIDFNPHVVAELRRRNVPCIYGDISHAQTLEHAHLERTRLVICTITDDVLRGTDNLRLLGNAKQVWPQAAVILSTEHVPQALEFYEAGADYVYVPRMHSAHDLARTITSGLAHGFGEIREEAQAELRQRDEVLA